MCIFGSVVHYLKIYVWATYDKIEMLLFIAPVWHHNPHFPIASILSIEKVRLLSYVVEYMF